MSLKDVNTAAANLGTTVQGGRPPVPEGPTHYLILGDDSYSLWFRQSGLVAYHHSSLDHMDGDPEPIVVLCPSAVGLTLPGVKAAPLKRYRR